MRKYNEVYNEKLSKQRPWAECIDVYATFVNNKITFLIAMATDEERIVMDNSKNTHEEMMKVFNDTKKRILKLGGHGSVTKSQYGDIITKNYKSIINEEGKQCVDREFFKRIDRVELKNDFYMPRY